MTCDDIATEDAGAVLHVDHFDGRNASARPAWLQIDGDMLLIRASAPARAHAFAADAGDAADTTRPCADLSPPSSGAVTRVPLQHVAWPERTRHGPRVAQLPDGGSLHCADGPAWDAWLQRQGQRESLVVRAQQSWRWVAASAVALLLVLGLGWQVGVPWLARGVVALTPLSLDTALGDAALASVDAQLLRPSVLSAAEQQRLQAAFDAMLAAQPPGSVPVHRLLFRQSRIGPNAFALPGGTLVMTDELVAAVDGAADMVVGVLAHELGHVHHRHGLRLVVQATLVGAVASLVLGDFSALLATAPVILGQAGYSRDAEREADAHATQMLRQAGISPAVMATFFHKMADWQDRDGERRSGASWLGIAIASHPADAERIRFFEAAAGKP